MKSLQRLVESARTETPQKIKKKPTALKDWKNNNKNQLLFSSGDSLKIVCYFTDSHSTTMHAKFVKKKTIKNSSSSWQFCPILELAVKIAGFF